MNRFRLVLLLGVLLGGALLAHSASAQRDADAAAVPVEIAVPTAPDPPRPGPGQPVEVKLSLTLNKLSEIDSVAETYHVDAYLNARWTDKAGAELLWRPGEDGRTVYLGDSVTELLLRVIWWPDLELINTVGGRDQTKYLLEVSSDGEIRYNERFQAELSSNMDFRKFPFDEQTFDIVFESFTYGAEDVVFVGPSASLGHLRDTPAPDWQIASPRTEVTRHSYGDDTYSRYTAYVDADRLPGYFVWQVFLPLFLILGTSWIVFWLTEIGDQLNVSFTCMLTLVAFNFYTATMLPQLPYNTFIEVVVISSYFATFLLIAYILVAERLRLAGRQAAQDRMVAAGRWLFPLGFALAQVLTALRFF